MRIERIRRLIWGVDVLLLLAIGAYFYLNLLQPDPPYDDPNQWARDRRTRERAPIREARAWSDFGWVVTFPKDGLKPPPPVEEVAEGEPTEKKSSLERDWTLITFTRVIDTDEALVILKSKADGSEVPLAIGSKVPGSAWRLRDLDEEGKAVFQLDGETEISILEIQEKEYGGEGGEFTPTEPGGVAAGSPGTGPGGRPDRNVRPGLDAVEVRPGHWELGPRERAYLSDENRVQEIQREVTAQPWKNPETGRYEGIALRKVKEDSYIARRGARKGDILVSINGQPVTSKADIVNYVKNKGRTRSSSS
jgi:hypothetical protein